MTVQDSAIAEAHFNQFRVTIAHRNYSGNDGNKLFNPTAKGKCGSVFSQIML